MITNSNGNFSRNLAICRPTSYCGRSPVPLSPITAKRTDLSFTGRVSWASETLEARIRMVGSAARMECLARRFMSLRFISRDHPRDEVDDQVCFGVSKDQIVAKNAILQLFRKLGKIEQQRGRSRLQGDAGRVGLVDLVRRLHRLG